MNNFVNRHIGPDEEQQNKMLSDLGLSNIDELVKEIPEVDAFFGTSDHSEILSFITGKDFKKDDLIDMKYLRVKHG